MGLFEKLAEAREPEPEEERVVRDAPKTEGQKWFEEEAERRRQELTKKN